MQDSKPAANRFEYTPPFPQSPCGVCGGVKTQVITSLHLRSATMLGGPAFEVDESHFECATCQGTVPR